MRIPSNMSPSVYPSGCWQEVREIGTVFWCFGEHRMCFGDLTAVCRSGWTFLFVCAVIVRAVIKMFWSHITYGESSFPMVYQLYLCSRCRCRLTVVFWNPFFGYDFEVNDKRLRHFFYIRIFFAKLWRMHEKSTYVPSHLMRCVCVSIDLYNLEFWLSACLSYGWQFGRYVIMLIATKILFFKNTMLLAELCRPMVVFCQHINIFRKSKNYLENKYIDASSSLAHFIQSLTSHKGFLHDSKAPST